MLRIVWVLTGIFSSKIKSAIEKGLPIFHFRGFSSKAVEVTDAAGKQPLQHLFFPFQL